MSVRLKAIAAAGLTLALTGCDGNSTPQTPTGPSGTSGFINVVVSGTVVDLEGVPIAGATVELPPFAKATTEANGRFALNPVQTREGTALPITVSGQDCLFATTSVTATPGTPVVDIKVTRVFPLSLDGSTTSILRTTEPLFSRNFFDEDLSGWQARHYRYATPVDTDISVELDWERIGNAHLEIWTDNGRISQPLDSKHLRVLGRNQRGSLAVVQRPEAGSLSMPVRFTLEARRSGGS